MASPKLRFKEFGRNWSIKPLKNICKINQGLQIAIENRFTDDGENRYFYITNEFLREGAKNTYFIENPPRNVICDENDILMTRTGNTGQVVTDVKGAFHNNFFKIDFDRSIINKNFFIEFLKKDTTQHLILKYAGASTIPDLNHSDFYRIVMPITTIEEQTKIASFLSAVDEKISQLTQKHELHSQYKQGMMQKLFSQQIRFKADDGSEFGEWVEWKFASCIDIFDNLRKPVSASERKVGFTPYYGANGIQSYIDGYTHEGEFILIAEDGANDLINYPVQYVNGKIWVNNHAHVVSGKQHIVDNKFLKYRLGSIDFTKYLVGGGRAKLNAGAMKEIAFLLPCLEEQTKIANFLSEIDQKIEVVAQQIEQAKIWKKGLLQQMFVQGESYGKLASNRELC